MKSLIIILSIASVTVSLAQKQTAVVKGGRQAEPEELPADLPPIPFTESGDVQYQEVVEIGGASKEDLYARAREWFAIAFNSADAVLEMDDRESGKLIGKPNNLITVLLNNVPVDIRLCYTVSLELKDGRYRYTINNVYYKSTSSPFSTSYPKEWITDEAIQNISNKRWRMMALSYRQQTFESMKSLISSLKTAMQKGNKSDDW